MADALKLADALAIAGEVIDRKGMLKLLNGKDEGELRAVLAIRPYIPDLLTAYAQKLKMTMSDLASICHRAPAQ